MGCLFALLAVITPRVAMVCLWLFTDAFSRAFDSALWPLLGFFFMPYTALAYMAAMIYNDHQLTGGWIVLLIVAVIADLGSGEEAGRSGSRKRRRTAPESHR